MFLIVPDMVIGVDHVVLSPTSVYVMWLHILGTADVEYDITWITPYEINSKTMRNTHATTINGLISNTEYYFQVQARNEGGIGEPSNKTQFITSKLVFILLITHKKIF